MPTHVHAINSRTDLQEKFHKIKLAHMETGTQTDVKDTHNTKLHAHAHIQYELCCMILRIHCSEKWQQGKEDQPCCHPSKQWILRTIHHSYICSHRTSTSMYIEVRTSLKAFSISSFSSCVAFGHRSVCADKNQSRDLLPFAAIRHLCSHVVNHTANKTVTFNWCLKTREPVSC